MTNALDKSLAAPNWQKIGIRPHHGINTPLFSLRTKKSSGVGEFLDLLPLIDLCSSAQFDLIQLLPINDSGKDPSPYNAISSKALHPIYLSLHALPHLESYPDLKQELDTFKVLNELPRVNYPLILDKKTNFLRRYFEKERNNINSINDYNKFIAQNPWLEAYAQFKSLKEAFGWQNWNEWPKKTPDEAKENSSFHKFVQYLCFKQMQKVKDYAKNKAIMLKGDIPILISPDSCDVWYEPHLFLLDYSAGAPPDMLQAEGQYWGFPLYNYETLAKENYHWWKERLQVASQLYDIYRLDHIVGFYRIWAFPRGDKKNGRFIPSDKTQWIPQGETLLKMMLQAANMLPIGEDLGVIPPEVRLSMRQLGICGTKVMRWERNWNGDKSFINPKDYIPESMTTVSTHDSDTLKLWWQNSPEEAEEYARSRGWDYSPVLSLEQHREILMASHNSGSLFHINLLQEYLDLFPNYTLSNLSNERINVPGTQTVRNWTFRYKPYLEDLVKDTNLIKQMHGLIEN